MFYTQKICISNDVITLFNKREYESFVFKIINLSKDVFPEEYEYVEEQSHGECDYIGKSSGIKFDAKLPFLSDQIKLLTNGKKHGPKIKEWLEMMQDECAEFQPQKIREDPNHNIKSTHLYKIIENAVKNDKDDENIIFFIPFPVVPSAKEFDIFNMTSNFLSCIYDTLKEEIDLCNRSIYVIHPSLKKNELALRNLNIRKIEFLRFDDLEKYISFEIMDVHSEE